MKKWLPCKAMAIAMLLTGSNAIAQQIQLQQHRYLPHYPSASAAAWYKGVLYVMGDDAPAILTLNKKLQVKRQLPAFAYPGKRIPYALKPDIESAVIIPEGRNHTLWLLPSFATAARNKAVRLEIDFSGATPSVLTLEPFSTGLAVTNIEGAAFIKGMLLMANRANSGAPVHYLLAFDLAKQVLPHKPVQQYTVALPPTPEGVGISGMEYLDQQDMLLLTVTTETKATTTADGTIGPSYLAIVRKASRQLQWGKTIEAAILIPLDPVLQQHKPMKIESVTVIKHKKRSSILVLTADNDDGTTHLFRVKLKHLR